jgi:hypothetical protein
MSFFMIYYEELAISSTLPWSRNQALNRSSDENSVIQIAQSFVLQKKESGLVSPKMWESFSFRCQKRILLRLLDSCQRIVRKGCTLNSPLIGCVP